VLATDAAGCVTRMNAIAEKLTGWTLAEAQGRPVAEVFHIINEQTRAPAVIPVERVLATGEIHGLANHTVIIARDGTEYPIADSAAPIRGKDGQTLGVVLVFRDVTEEKRAEKAIRESEARYRTLFDSIDEGYCIIEMIFNEQDMPVDYRFLEINPSFEKQTGLRNALGKRMRELAPTHETHWFETYGRIAQTGQPARFQNWAEQLHRWFDVYAFRFGEPKQRQVAIIFDDITERKQAEDALVRSQENLAVTLQSIGDAVLATDAAGRVTRLNPVAEKLTGWTEAEAQGRPVAEIFNIIYETTRQPANIPVDKVLATGAIQGLANHTVVIARDGTEHPIADSAAPIRDKTGKIIGVVLVFRDVTAERAVELSLLESERRLRALNEELEQRVAQRAAELQESERLGRAALDALDAHVAVLDEHGTILATNQAWQFFASKNGLSSEQAGMGINYLATCAPDAGPVPESAGKIAHGIREVIAGRKREFSMEYDCHSPKEKRWFLCRVTRFAGIGPTRVVVAHENITHMKELERQQFRAQRMESLGTLAGGVAHDLNNALAPILMGVELLKEQYPNATDMITMVENSAKRGADMVRQLLTFAKGAEGKRVSLQVRHLVREIEKIITSTFPKNIQVETNCATDMPPVLGDATQLHQVILNLCVNARDAMPNGGTITIVAQALMVDAVYASTAPEANPGKYLRLQISDTGTGIPPEIIDRIFDPFFTTKSPDKGTGLGLSNVLGIVKGHGGFIKVYSQPGQGSTFAIHLPADAKTADTEHLVRPAGNFHGRGEIILFVDDEPAVRDVAQSVLKHLNFRPLTAADGSEGLLEAMDHRTEISAIIADLHMPHMDGLAFVRALRRVLPDIPVIMASGRMDPKVRDELLTLNVKTFLDKPFTEIQLATVLQEILPKP
jgi:PAS domain S-box-containing protein